MDVVTALAMLDAEGMRAAVASLPACADAVAGTGELAASWVKPGRYFNTHYRFAGREAREIRASAFLLDPRQAARVVDSCGEHTCERHGEGSCGACTTARVADNLVVQAFPSDYRLPTLALCLDARSVRRATDAPAKIDAAQPLAYRPGMRCQIAYLSQARRVMYGKVSVETRGDGYSYRTHRMLAAALESSTRSIRVPPPIAYSESLRLTLVGAVEGVSLYDLVFAGARPIEEVAAAAIALSAFHALEGVVEDRPYTIGDEQALVEQWIALCAEMCPDLAPALAECRRAMTDSACEPRPPHATLHRDFYDKQVLCLDGTPPAVIDMDTAACGDPEIDVANFCAHLWFRSLQREREGAYAELEDVFLGAYPGSLERRRLDWYRRATLVRLACSYALRPHWRHLAPRVIARALEA